MAVKLEEQASTPEEAYLGGKKKSHLERKKSQSSKKDRKESQKKTVSRKTKNR